MSQHNALELTKEVRLKILTLGTDHTVGITIFFFLTDVYRPWVSQTKISTTFTASIVPARTHIFNMFKRNLAKGNSRVNPDFPITAIKAERSIKIL